MRPKRITLMLDSKETGKAAAKQFWTELLSGMPDWKKTLGKDCSTTLIDPKRHDVSWCTGKRGNSAEDALYNSIKKQYEEEGWLSEGIMVFCPFTFTVHESDGVTAQKDHTYPVTKIFMRLVFFIELLNNKKSFSEGFESLYPSLWNIFFKRSNNVIYGTRALYRLAHNNADNLIALKAKVNNKKRDMTLFEYLDKNECGGLRVIFEAYLEQMNFAVVEGILMPYVVSVEAEKIPIVYSQIEVDLGVELMEGEITLCKNESQVMPFLITFTDALKKFMPGIIQGTFNANAAVSTGIQSARRQINGLGACLNNKELRAVLEQLNKVVHDSGNTHLLLSDIINIRAKFKDDITPTRVEGNASPCGQVALAIKLDELINVYIERYKLLKKIRDNFGEEFENYIRSKFFQYRGTPVLFYLKFLKNLENTLNDMLLDERYKKFSEFYDHMHLYFEEEPERFLKAELCESLRKLEQAKDAGTPPEGYNNPDKRMRRASSGAMSVEEEGDSNPPLLVPVSQGVFSSQGSVIEPSSHESDGPQVYRRKKTSQLLYSL